MTIDTVQNDGPKKKESNMFDSVDSLMAQGWTAIDAIIEWCERNSIEPETAGKLIQRHPRMRGLVENEAEGLNYLPKRSKLPL